MGILVHLQGDFLVVSQSDLQLWQKDLNKIMFLFKDIGIRIKQSNKVLPCTLLTFWALRKALHSLQTYKARKTVTLQELQSIISVLNFLVLWLFRDVHFLGDSMTLQ